jgi:hypothetical protein
LTPPQIYRHQIVSLNNNSLILFGGINENNEKFNELYFFEIKEKKWSILFPSGEYPSARTYHNMNLLNENLIIFGGFSNSLLNDCYVLNLKGKYFQNENQFENQNKINNNNLNIPNLKNIHIENLNLENKIENKKQNKNENLIFLNTIKLESDFEIYEKNILSSIENKGEIDPNKKKDILISAFKEELKLMNNQVIELKNKIEYEINKNLCKVKDKYFYHLILILI